MRKNSLIKLLTLALSATLMFTGCDSGGGDDGGNGGGAAVVGGGGGAAAAAGGGGAAGGVTGVGLTGGTINFGGSSAAAAAAATGGAATTAATGAAATTTGGATNTTFLNTVTASNFITSLNNPTAFTALTVGGTPRLFVLDGFQTGQNNGRLLAITADGLTPVGQVTDSSGNNLANLDNPFDLQSDGTNLYISVGFGVNQDGAILRVSNLQVVGTTISGNYEIISDDPGNATADFLVNPTFMTLVGGLNGQDYVYWTEYSASTATGRVRRCRTNGTGGLPETVIEGLNFPAGIDHDGTNFVVCDSAGGAGNGQVLRFPIVDPLPATPIGAGAATVVTVLNQGGANAEQAILRPFDVIFDGRNGFFFTEGATLSRTASFPQPTGPGLGAVRFLPRTSTIARLVSSGLANCAGIDAVDPNTDGSSSVLFAEGAQTTNGRILRRAVNTASVSNTTPNEVENGLQSPLMVAIASDTTPSFFSSVGFDRGVANGLIRIYRP